jgi:hypothetical protein
MSNGLASFARIPSAVFALLLASPLTGCQDYRDAFNPMQILCPGDFDPVTNECVVKTGGAREE